jgi:hypothetical protein
MSEREKSSKPAASKGKPGGIELENLVLGYDALPHMQTGNSNVFIGTYPGQFRVDAWSGNEALDCPDPDAKLKSRRVCRGCVNLDTCKPKK